MDEKYQPLQFPPLLKDAWVFSIYGFIISAVMGEYNRKGASLDIIQGFMLEPFSIKAFFSITFVGFILVALGAIILGMDEAKARKNMVLFIVTPIYWLQRRFFSTNNKERRLLAAVMVIYIITIYGLILYLDPEHFFLLSVSTIILFSTLWVVKSFLVNKTIKPTQ